METTACPMNAKLWTLAAFVSSLLLLAGPLAAQTAPTPAPPPVVAPALPGALPGDAPLPPIDFQLTTTLGPPAGTPANPPLPPVTLPLPLNLALEAAQTALATCLADGYRVGVAVTNEVGQIRVGLAADGVAQDRVYTAVRKSLAAAAFNSSTLDLRAKFSADPALRAKIAPNMSVFPGGLPILVGGRVIGAIGVSGAFGYEEEMCAKAGIAKIQSRLK